MHLTSPQPLLSLLLLLTTTALATDCLLSVGHLANGALADAYIIRQSAEYKVENILCQFPAHIDQDGHYALEDCNPGYIFTFSQDGTQAWYENDAGETYSGTQEVTDGHWTGFLFC